MKRTGWKLKKKILGETFSQGELHVKLNLWYSVHGKHVPCILLENSPKKLGALIGFKSFFYVTITL